MYVCGFPPYKSSLRLPALASYSLAEIKKAAKEQGCKPPPQLPAGMFQVVKSLLKEDTLVQVAVYRFTHTKGCRTTGSKIHRNLHVPLEKHKSLTVLQAEAKCKVGSQFLFNHETLYTVDGSGKIVFEEDQQKVAIISGHEDSKCTLLVNRLAAHYPDCTVKVWSNTDHFCPFQGGGDIIMYKDACTAACVTTCEDTALSQDSSELPTPPSAESRSPHQAALSQELMSPSPQPPLSSRESTGTPPPSHTRTLPRSACTYKP